MILDLQMSKFHDSLVKIPMLVQQKLLKVDRIIFLPYVQKQFFKSEQLK